MMVEKRGEKKKWISDQVEVAVKLGKIFHDVTNEVCCQVNSNPFFIRTKENFELVNLLRVLSAVVKKTIALFAR